MTTDRQMTAQLGAWFDERATSVVPERLLERSLARVEATRQRPRWIFFVGAPGAARAGGRLAAVPAWVVVAVALLAAAGVVAVGARLISTPRPAVLPDATKAALASSDHLPDSNPTPETSAAAPALGGRPILAHEFTRVSDPENHGLYAIDAGTGERTLLGILPGTAITGSANPFSFQRSGDDRHVLIQGGFGAGLVSTTPAGNAYGFVTEANLACCQGALEGVTLSPAGDRLAGIHADGLGDAIEIVVSDLTGGHVKKLAIPAVVNWLGGLAWAPDESALLYFACRPCNEAGSPDEKQTPFHGHLYIIPLDGGDPRELLDVDNGALVGAWSPDGKELVVGTYRCAPGSFMPRCEPTGTTDAEADSLSTVAIASGTETVIGRVKALYGFSWSPDGASIAYGAGDGSYVIQPDGSGKVKVADAPGVPSWSPDGQWLVLGGHDPDEWGLWIVAADGTGLRRVGVGYAGVAW
ncbi:MAG TPA: hypothetical protein VHR16_08680 [Candidatus Limnocylindrales bacterium]|nr:hypothetical protein [Candidatus Limnocylindrales bacterium]